MDFTIVGGHISNWLPPNLTFVSISTSNCPSNMILVSKPMYVSLVKEEYRDHF